MNKVSVIVPVYNAKHFLRECLESIMNQTYPVLEIILVDDGSTDGSSEICDNYARKDDRVIVIHKGNGGSADARNRGLTEATGHYIAFVDQDDVICPNMYEILVRVLKDCSADIVECDYVSFNGHQEMHLENSEQHARALQCFSAEWALENLMQGVVRQVVWNKLYTAEVIADLAFEKGRLIEDEIWTFRVIGNAEKFVKITVPLYCYRQHPDSIMGSGYSVRRVDDGLYALKERISYMEDNFVKLGSLAKRTYCFACIFHYQMLLLHRNIDPKRVLRRQMIARVRDVVDDEFVSTLSLKARVWLRLFCCMPELTSSARNVLKIGL